MGEDDPGITFGGVGEPLLRVETICEAVSQMRQRRHGVPVRCVFLYSLGGFWLSLDASV